MIRRLSGSVAALLLLAPAATFAQAPPPNALPPTITLPSALVTEIALYLQDRPYREVAGLLGALQQAVAEQSRAATPPAGTTAGPPASPR